MMEPPHIVQACVPKNPRRPVHNPQISVVVPVFRNAATLEELARRLRAVLTPHGLMYELILVDDASPDDSLAVTCRLVEKDPAVGVVLLAKNIGQHQAVWAGLRYARAPWIVVMDADLQDPPEEVPRLLETAKQGYDVVFAGRRGRYQPSWRMFTSRLFKTVLHVLTGVPRDAGMFLLMSRRMQQALIEHPVKEPFIPAMIGLSRLRICSVPVTRSVRPAGNSSYSDRDRLRLGLQALWGVVRWRTRGYPALSGGPVADTPVRTVLGVCQIATGARSWD